METFSATLRGAAAGASFAPAAAETVFFADAELVCFLVECVPVAAVGDDAFTFAAAAGAAGCLACFVGLEDGEGAAARTGAAAPSLDARVDWSKCLRLRYVEFAEGRGTCSYIETPDSSGSCGSRLQPFWV